MKVTDFAVLISSAEGLKKQVSIAQIKEILRIINKIFLGAFYREIKKL